MASDTEDSEAAADRLEAALERIAEAAAREEAPPADQFPSARHAKKLLRDSTV